MSDNHHILLVSDNDKAIYQDVCSMYSTDRKAQILNLLNKRGGTAKMDDVDRCIAIAANYAIRGRRTSSILPAERKEIFKNLSNNIRNVLDAIQNLDRDVMYDLKFISAYENEAEMSGSNRSSVWNEDIIMALGDAHTVCIKSFPELDKLSDDEHARLKSMLERKWHKQTYMSEFVDRKTLVDDAICSLRSLQKWCETAFHAMPTRRGAPRNKEETFAAQNLIAVWKKFRTDTLSNPFDESGYRGELIDFGELVLCPVLPVDISNRSSISNILDRALYREKSRKKKLNNPI